MMFRPLTRLRVVSTGTCAAMTWLVLVPGTAVAQLPPPDVRTTDSVTVEAGAHYQGGGLRRMLFGNDYRGLWITPIRVPVLDLRRFEGGLTPVKAGGGHQTRSLRLRTRDGVEYAFRSVDKDDVALPPELEDVGLAHKIGRELTANNHPASNLVVRPFYEATGVLHESSVLVVMPDDTVLGKFRKEFAHRLGVLLRYPDDVKAGVPAFADAIAIIDSDSLLQLLNRDPAERVDATAFLTARLIDLLVNNSDRSRDNWKWARLRPPPVGKWQPIARDLDKALVSQGGTAASLIRIVNPRMVTFDSTFPSLAGMTGNSLELDRRLLGELSRPAWDSVARFVSGRITDPVIDASMELMPVEYRASAAAIAAKLRLRRDSLPAIADRLYTFLGDGVINLHATDADDRARITRIDGRYVEVRLDAGDGAPYFIRRYDARETTEIRVYLHGGNDQALVVGDVPNSISLRIIGGNGTNRLVDSSRVGGRSNTAHLYDAGTVSHVRYGTDTSFNRRPLVQAPGGLVDPGRDHGTDLSPRINLDINHDMGIIPSLGVAWRRFGFRQEPYASRIALDGQYSLKNSGAAVTLTADQRQEKSPLHFVEVVRMSELEMLNFHGFGNSSPGTPGLAPGVSAPRTDYYALHQRQWLVHPAVALTLGPKTDLRFGPVLQYFVTDSTPNRYVSAARPYGAGQFGEAGLRMSLAHDNRVPKHHAREGTVLDLSASYFPALWDVRSGFGSISAIGAAYFDVPLPLHPYLALRGGAKKVFGDFPFQEAAFIGGRLNVRQLDPQRYAGDAALYASAELRVPVARFTLLLPLNVGLVATEDVGRVYVKGDSPDGWHNVFGAGFYVAFHGISSTIRVVHKYEVGRPAGLALSFAVPSVIR